MKLITKAWVLGTLAAAVSIGFADTTNVTNVTQCLCQPGITHCKLDNTSSAIPVYYYSSVVRPTGALMLATNSQPQTMPLAGATQHCKALGNCYFASTTKLNNYDNVEIDESYVPGQDHYYAVTVQKPYGNIAVTVSHLPAGCA